jgi:hypothetical protein
VEFVAGETEFSFTTQSVHVFLSRKGTLAATILICIWEIPN